MERHEILDAMSGLKLYGMRASFDEIAGVGGGGNPRIGGASLLRV